MSVYFIQRGESGPVKIGLSRNPKARLAALKTASDEPLRILGIMPGNREVEQRLHLRFASARLEGEWFSPIEEIIELAASFATADIGNTDLKIGFANLEAQFRADPGATVRYLAENLPSSTFAKIVDLAGDIAKAHAIAGLNALGAV